MLMEIPGKLKAKVEEIARRKDIPVEELVMVALNKAFSILNPEEMAEVHLELCEKFLREAEELLKKGDGIQASEKGWGAAAQVVKAAAAREGKELRTHGELWKYVSGLRERRKDEEIGVLWDRANSLHTNFYENWLPLKEVEIRIRDVRKFVDKVKALISETHSEERNL